MTTTYITQPQRPARYRGQHRRRFRLRLDPAMVLLGSVPLIGGTVGAVVTLGVGR